MARANRKAVLIVMWSLEALCRGSNGAFCKQVKIQDKSHLGIRDLCTGRCSSKDLINFDKTGLDPIVTSFKVKSIRDHSSISFDGTYLIQFLREKVNKEISYHCKRGRDQINLRSMTPIRVYNPFRIIDFFTFVLILRQVCNYFENFLSLIDCLITPKHEGRVMGGFGVGIFHLTVSEVLEIVEDELGADTRSCSNSENQGAGVKKAQ